MKKPIRIAAIILSVFAIAGILTGIYMFNRRSENLLKAKPDHTITATGLLEAFEKDEASATSVYVNKVIDVTGAIKSLIKGENNTTSISLDTGSDLSGVICTMATGADVTGLSPGQTVTLRGECSGFLMDVLLNNCVVISNL